MTNSEFIIRDKLLLFLILSKFDVDLLNKFFGNIKDISDFMNYFLNLPEEVLRSIISRNYHLFQYIMLLMAEREFEYALTKEFYDKYKSDIEQFSKLNDIMRKIKEKDVGKQDKPFDFYKRDIGRISFLVNMLKDLPDPYRAVDYFNKEKLFIDELEMKIVLAVLTDPMFIDIFKYYDKMLEFENI